MAFPMQDVGMWSGLLCGALFGVVLESAGFGSPAKLTAQFRLSDWSVFKVMFTAIVVAATGLWLLRVTGLMNAEAIFVPTSFVMAAAVGGALVGAGFAVGGYCPGTSVVGLFSGRLDALVFVLGLLVGTVVFAGLYGPAVEQLMALGEVAAGDTFADAFGIPDVLMLAVLGVALVLVFWLGARMERARHGPVTAEQAVAGADSQLAR
jgi:uncharacterized protein